MRTGQRGASRCHLGPSVILFAEELFRFRFAPSIQITRVFRGGRTQVAGGPQYIHSQIHSPFRNHSVRCFERFDRTDIPFSLPDHRRYTIIGGSLFQVLKPHKSGAAVNVEMILHWYKNALFHNRFGILGRRRIINPEPLQILRRHRRRHVGRHESRNFARHLGRSVGNVFDTLDGTEDIRRFFACRFRFLTGHTPHEQYSR